MATRRKPPSSDTPSPARSGRQELELAKVLEFIGASTAAHPKLFPNGVNKIEIELEPGKLRCLVEGPAATPTARLETLSATLFEFQSPPEALVTAASPLPGSAADQDKLKKGKSIEGAAKVFNRDCKGHTSTYLNNCAHYLSDALIESGYSELAIAHACISSGGHCASPNCKSGGTRPIRAKDMRCWFEEKDPKPTTSIAKGTGFYAVYQERQSDGQGHVVILDSDTWKYYGTGWFESNQPAPNDWKHWYYSWN